MPELPDVECNRRYFEKVALGRSICRVHVHEPRILAHLSRQRLVRALQGRLFTATSRRGKYLFAITDTSAAVVFHFGMTGSLRYVPTAGGVEAHERLSLVFEQGGRLAYICPRLLGRIAIAPSVDGFIAGKGLGPDALDVGRADLVEILTRSQRAIKAVLLDQARIAGIGNIYADEILWQLQVRPQANAADLSGEQVASLRLTARKVLLRAIQRNADPRALPRTYMLPHRARGGTCPRCRRAFTVTKVAGRTTYYCRDCQK